MSKPESETAAAAPNAFRPLTHYGRGYSDAKPEEDIEAPRRRRIVYARELDQLAATRRAEASRLRAIIRATEAEADRIEAKAREIMQEVVTNA